MQRPPVPTATPVLTPGQLWKSWPLEVASYRPVTKLTGMETQQELEADKDGAVFNLLTNLTEAEVPEAISFVCRAFKTYLERHKKDEVHTHYQSILTWFERFQAVLAQSEHDRIETETAELCRKAKFYLKGLWEVNLAYAGQPEYLGPVRIWFMAAKMANTDPANKLKMIKTKSQTARQHASGS